MKVLEVYKTHDGKFFEDEDQAQQHENELFTAELFDLMKLGGFNGWNDTALIAGCRAMASNKEEVKRICETIYKILEDV